jgi:hypothetical protein
MSRAGIIGVSGHGGWAVLVTADGNGTLLDRRRVELVDERLPKNSAPQRTAGAPRNVRKPDLLETSGLTARASRWGMVECDRGGKRRA